MDYNPNGGNQNNGGDQWDKWNSNASNSSYYNQPVHKPYGQGFTMASVICGVMSITACFTGVLSLPLGALGILFAMLVYRKGKRLNTPCVLGISTSCIGLVFGLLIIVYSLVMLPILLKDETFRNQLNMMTQQVYGIDFDTIMKEYYDYTIGE